MRISLLLERESFAEIIERTLQKFWTETLGQPYQVVWQQGRGNAGIANGKPHQVWLCNSYLNAIFHPSIRPPAFDPIRREYGRSTVAWRRPLQKAYVNLATRPGSSRWLSHARMRVVPEVPRAESLLVVPGNQKIRQLDHVAGECTCILKDGFEPDGLYAELAARGQAAELDLPVPRLIEVCRENGWFREQYISGTPLNRLSAGRAATCSQALAALRRLVVATQTVVATEDYVERRLCELQRMLSACRWLRTADCQVIEQGVRRLQTMLIGSGGPAQITVSLTHGDFQPANILANDNGPWLIDWENAADRPSHYDLLVLGIGSRMPHGLADRLARWVRTGVLESLEPAARQPHVDWPGFESTDLKQRQWQASLFLLEEVAWHAKENTNRLFTRASEGLLMIAAELRKWLTQVPN